jgi:hypothetical protein
LSGSRGLGSFMANDRMAGGGEKQKSEKMERSNFEVEVYKSLGLIRHAHFHPKKSFIFIGDILGENRNNCAQSCLQNCGSACVILPSTVL